MLLLSPTASALGSHRPLPPSGAPGPPTAAPPADAGPPSHVSVPTFPSRASPLNVTSWAQSRRRCPSLKLLEGRGGSVCGRPDPSQGCPGGTRVSPQPPPSCRLSAAPRPSPHRRATTAQPQGVSESLCCFSQRSFHVSKRAWEEINRCQRVSNRVSAGLGHSPSRTPTSAPASQAPVLLLSLKCKRLRLQK